MRKRRTRSQVSGLPSHGWYLDKHLSRILGMSLASFRFEIERQNVPHQKFGPVLSVDVAELHKVLTGGRENV
ncbi:MAG: hypothetical protein KDA80_19775 [Planctomycetaceae bacterium]|nr:hypothetical protein [Planctomycetaceae bacterium]